MNLRKDHSHESKPTTWTSTGARGSVPCGLAARPEARVVPRTLREGSVRGARAVESGLGGALIRIGIVAVFFQPPSTVIINQPIKTFSDGCLGLSTDEGRSEMR